MIRYDTTKNKPKKQHHLPEMFLKGFTNNSKNIFMFDSQSSKISGPRNISSVAVKKHLYTVTDGQRRNYTVEEKFSEIENYATALLNKISSDGFEKIIEDDIPELIDFIVFTFIRTPRYIDVSEDIMGNEGVLSEMRKVNSDDADIYIKACASNRGLSYAASLQGSFEYRHKAITHNFDALLLTAEHGSPPFILNDAFCCFEMVTKDTYYDNDNIDWSKMNVKKHFPISNKHCVTFIPKSDDDRKGTPTINYTKASISKEGVRQINRLSFLQRQRYTYCSEKTVLSDELKASSL